MSTSRDMFISSVECSHVQFTDNEKFLPCVGTSSIFYGSSSLNLT